MQQKSIKKIYLLTGMTSIILGVLLLSSAISFIASIFQTETKDVFMVLQNNWLILIFKLHAGLISIQDDPLRGLNLLDILILAIFSVTSYGIYIDLRKSSKLWSVIAFAFTLIAILLFLISQIAGRSTVMLSALIFSLVMMKDTIYKKATIYTGIISSIFLFAGDLTVGIHAKSITILFGIGYLLLILWFFLISRRLLKLGRHNDVSDVINN
jgi:hypothetical protein